MDAVIVSTAFNKIQSQECEVEHKTIKELQKGRNLVEKLATIPGVLKFLLEHR
jgi:hypothetical protein